MFVPYFHRCFLILYLIARKRGPLFNCKKKWTFNDLILNIFLEISFIMNKHNQKSQQTYLINKM